MTDQPTNESQTDALIVGAGPAGLACAIALKEIGLCPLILDRGSVADAIRRFPSQMTFFSTAELLEVGGVPFLSAGFRPTRVEAMRYYLKVAQVHGLDVRTDVKVDAIQSVAGGFRVQSNKQRYSARYVVVATGYYDSYNPFTVPGSDLPKVHRSYTEPFAYVGKEVAIVGGRNSAVEMALELFRYGARVTLIHRGSRLSDGVKYWMLPDIENRIKASEVKALFETEVEEVHPDSLVLKGKHAGKIPNDVLFVMIGYRPKTDLLERAGVAVDRQTAVPHFDPETFETNVPGLFVAGSVVAGVYNNRVFIENGRLHGGAIADAIQRK